MTNRRSDSTQSVGESKPKILFVLCGNCRTFIDCVDSCYENIISSFVSPLEKYAIHLYLYLKLTDPGPKGQYDFDFTYKDVEKNALIEKIKEMQEEYPACSLEYKIVPDNEISDIDIMSQVKARTKYDQCFDRDSVLLRALHCHYNFERCGNYILEKEAAIGDTFQTIVYIRPDLYFIQKCESIDTYHSSIVTLGEGPYVQNNDHLAIIPRKYLEAFFLDRMEVYRTNTETMFGSPEDVYWNTIPFEVKPIGKYYIKRP